MNAFNMDWCLWALTALAVVVWSLLFERTLYYRFVARPAVVDWCDRLEKVEGSDVRVFADLYWFVSGTRLMRKLLPVLIKVAPILGLLGTVTALIDVFIGMGGTSVNIPELLKQLSTACVSTLLGMLIAVPAWAFYIALSQYSSRLEAQMKAQLGGR